MIALTAAQAWDALVMDEGVSISDAYDMLADAGFDPHPDAPLTLLTADTLAGMLSGVEL